MFDNKYLLIFAITTFILLSIVGAGIFLDDEWSSAQQLKQLGEGHQISTSEGTYGYSANGTAGSYFGYRSERLMYTMALPIASLPMLELIKISNSGFGLLIILAWFFLGAFVWGHFAEESIYSRRSTYIYGGLMAIFCIITLLNIILLKDYTINKFSPIEVLAIVLMNIIMFGLFSVVLYKIIEELFTGDRLKLFAFIATLSCTSLIFWVGACKDHILAVLIASTILLLLVYYTKYSSMKALDFAMLLTGLLIWIRIEFGIGVICAISVYCLIYYREDILHNIKFLICSLFIGTIPMWINNYFSTGSVFIHPFLLANRGGGLLSADDFMAANFGSGDWFKIAFHFLFAPSSGAVALLTIIPLALIVVVVYILKPIKLERVEKLLLIFAFVSSIYYFVMSTIQMQADIGIMPDLRYLIFFYTPITLFAISIISKALPKLNYKKIIIYFILITGLLFILYTAYAASLSHDGTYRDLDRIVNTLSTIGMGLGVVAVVNDIRLNTKYTEYALPLVIAIPMAWQLVMLFIYQTSKVNGYPMILPMTQFVFNYLFGLVM